MEPTWRKSSYSSDQGGNCVEVCTLDDGPAVRDSKNQAGAVLTFTAAQWSAFTTGLRTGDFD
jgi:Domain of unknown function (DUF397)